MENYPETTMIKDEGFVCCSCNSRACNQRRCLARLTTRDSPLSEAGVAVLMGTKQSLPVAGITAVYTQCHDWPFDKGGDGAF